jgi:hypothetical protein
MAIIFPFQGKDVGSIPIARSAEKILSDIKKNGENFSVF